MTVTDVQKECVFEKWVPLMVMRMNDKVILPCFRHTDVARRFIERNLPKGTVCGVVNLTIRDAEWIDEKGWSPAVYDFPRKLTDVVEFDVEILEYDSDHEVIVQGA